MATTLSEPEPLLAPQPSLDAGEERPDVVLIERLPEHLRMSRGAALLTAGLAVFFWRLCSRPLFHTDVWGHLSYGRWIWEHAALPATEPFLPLAKGMPLVDTSWLSQLLGYAVVSLVGNVGLQFVMALTVTATLALLTRLIYRKTHSSGMAWLGMGVMLWLALQQICVGWGGEMATLIRPQIAGVLIYTWIFCRAVGQAPRRIDWVFVPLATCLWANLHGSFVMGPLLLGTLCIGRALDRVVRTGKLKSVWNDSRTVQWFLIAELAALAALINPYGIGLYTEVLTFASNPNLADILDWEPLTLREGQGRAAAVVAGLLVILYRLSPRRVSLSEFLLLAGLGAWAMWTSRMLIWFAIPAAYYTTLHWNAVRVKRNRVLTLPTQERTGLWTVIAVASVWMGFALSPMGTLAMHRKQLPLRGTVSADTPLGAVEYLNKQKEPLRGQVFNTYEWGDYLTWAGPKNMQLFVDSHVHIIPREVWVDYLAIVRAGANWDDHLDRYSVNYVIIDPRALSGLTRQLRSDERWKLSYEDGISVIFTRKKPI